MFVGIGVGIGRNRFAQGIFNAYNLRVVADGGITEAGQCVNAVTGLLLTSSLLIIPSGYKGGKAYAQIPTNGNGDLTWTRASDAWRTNADGLIQRVPWNLLQRSEEFADAYWTKINGATITANSVNAPNGTLTADTLSVATNTYSGLGRAVTGVSGIYNASVYAKKNTKNWLYLIDVAGVGARAWFDLENGVLGTVANGYTATITNVGDGWYRCTLANNNAQTLAFYQLGLADANNGITPTSSGSAFIWGAQLVEGSSAQTYFPTTDRLNVPRLSYMYGSCPALLLEPQRTNVVLHSGDLSQSAWSKTNYALTNVTAIQGLTATRITKNSTNNGNYAGTGGRNVVNTVGTFASGVKAFSVLLRKGNTAKVGLLINQILVGASISAQCEFDFSTETFTNVSSGLTATFEKPTTDVYRLILVVNDIGTGTSKAIWIAPVDSSNNTVTDGYVDIAYFQWELGAYPTTYIPTTTASATRVSDSFLRNNIYTNGLITSSGGTWFVELRNNIVYTRDNSSRIGFGDTSNLQNNSFFLNPQFGGGRFIIFKSISNSLTQLLTTTTSTIKVAIKWNGSTADVFVNGTKQVSATAFTTTNMEFLFGDGVGVPTFVQAMALYPSPLSDTDCTIITTL
jgi:hypothetical protein